jgi:hypothetical protein
MGQLDCRRSAPAERPLQLLRVAVARARAKAWEGSIWQCCPKRGTPSRTGAASLCPGYMRSPLSRPAPRGEGALRPGLGRGAGPGRHFAGLNWTKRPFNNGSSRSRPWRRTDSDPIAAKGRVALLQRKERVLGTAGALRAATSFLAKIGADNSLALPCISTRST